MRFEAIRTAKLASMLRSLAKSAMITAWIHGGALYAPPCIEGEVMGYVARGRQIFVVFATMIAFMHIRSTQC